MIFEDASDETSSDVHVAKIVLNLGVEGVLYSLYKV